MSKFCIVFVRISNKTLKFAQNTLSMKHLRFLFWIFVGFGLFSCRPRTEIYQVGTDIRDSVYIYSKELYLWTDNLPDIFTFKPKNYASPEEVILSVRTFSPVIGGKRADRFSFVSRKIDWDNASAGNRVDYGCGYRFLTPNDLRISFVYANSAAGKKGIQRGWRLLKVNNIVPDTSASTINQLNEALFASNSVTIQFQKPNNTTETITLTPENYSANFVLHKQVVNTSGKKIAYLVLNGFLGANNGKATETELNQTFDFFASAGADELVVDLRYNTGGYVYLAHHLCNLIAPASANGQIMLQERWNERYKNFNATTKFNNPNPKLNLSRVVFITTGSTASASELVINALKPYMEVKIIGRATSGKPVGFPVVPIIMDKSNAAANYVVAPVAFQSFNANGFGDYFDGLQPDKIQIDDVSRNFGDTQEACLQDAITYLTTGILQRTMSSEKILQQPTNANHKLQKEDWGAFKYMQSFK